MDPVSSTPSKPKIDLLPTASSEAMGCLFLSGSCGSFGLIFVCLLVIAEASSLIYSLIEGKPYRTSVHFHPNSIHFAHWVLSWVAYQAIKARTRQPWVFLTASACLAVFCYYLFTANMLTFSYPGASEAAQRQVGAWIMVTLASLVFLRFTFSRRNLHYYGLIRTGAEE
jgi:hypothetical protein